MHNHYEYKVFRRTELGTIEFFGQVCLATAEACRKDFLRRFPENVNLRCVIRNSCGYVPVMIKAEGRKLFRHLPDTGWHVQS